MDTKRTRTSLKSSMVRAQRERSVLKTTDFFVKVHSTAPRCFEQSVRNYKNALFGELGQKLSKKNNS